jgi:hypothetical protein
MNMDKALSPEYAATLPANILNEYRNALASSLHLVFIVIAIIAIIAFSTTLFMPKGRPEEEPNAAGGKLESNG